MNYLHFPINEGPVLSTAELRSHASAPSSLDEWAHLLRFIFLAFICPFKRHFELKTMEPGYTLYSLYHIFQKIDPAAQTKVRDSWDRNLNVSAVSEFLNVHLLSIKQES